MVIVLGSANMDLVAYGPRLPAPGETVLAERFAQSPGGKGANQAVAAARAGARTVFVGSVGTDAFGDALAASLGGAGVETTYLSRAPDVATGVALIAVDDAGRNQIVVAPGANRTVGHDAVAAVRSMLRPGMVVVMQLEVPLQPVIDMARWAHAAGAIVVLNPAPAQPLSNDLLSIVDVLVPNEHELVVLSGLGPGAPPETAASALLGHGVRSVIVTLGGEGVLLVGPAGCERIPAHAVTVRDTTGAGDAFVGALAARLADGASLAQAACYGNAAAALSVQVEGAQPSMATAIQIAALLEAGA